MARQISIMVIFLTTVILTGCAPSNHNRVPTPIIATIPPLPSLEETMTPKETGDNFSLSSPLIRDNGVIISQFTCDGPNLSPPLVWENSPQGQKSYAIIMDDPDAPGGLWVHWVLYNIPSNRTDLPQNIEKTETVTGIGVQGTNSTGKTHYEGPCPPYGNPHHYIITLYALDTLLFLPPGTGQPELETAIEDHILGKATLSGFYQRVQEEASCCADN